MFNIKINKVKNIHDNERNFHIYEKDGNNYLEKDNVTYILPNGNISGKNKNYFINGKLINVETPELSYKKA